MIAAPAQEQGAILFLEEKPVWQVLAGERAEGLSHNDVGVSNGHGFAKQQSLGVLGLLQKGDWGRWGGCGPVFIKSS